MWDLPRPGLEPVSPALADRFSTTAPPGKPISIVLTNKIHPPPFKFDLSKWQGQVFLWLLMIKLALWSPGGAILPRRKGLGEDCGLGYARVQMCQCGHKTVAVSPQFICTAFLQFVCVYHHITWWGVCLVPSPGPPPQMSASVLAVVLSVMGVSVILSRWFYHINDIIQGVCSLGSFALV